MSLQTPPRSLARTEIDFFTLAPDGGGIGDVTEAFALLLGRAAGEIGGRALLDHVYPDDRADLRENLDDLDTDTPTTLECRFVQGDGQAVYVEWVARPLGDDEGWRIAGTDTADLTLLLADRRALRTRLDLAIGQATVALWDLDVVTGGFNWEPVAAEILGIDEADLPATADALVTLAHPADREALSSALERLLAEGTTEVGIRVGIEPTIRYLSVRGRLLDRGRRREPDRAVGLLLDITVEKALEEQLLRLSVSDGLTGVRNRRGFDQSLRGEVRRSAQNGDPMALLMVDIDHFKRFNDTYGHIVGDQALVGVARALGGALRQEGDILARYGGEEFAVILPATDLDVAEQIGDRLLEAVRGVRLRQAGEWSPSVSVGITVHGAGDPKTKAGELLARADKALYSAKHRGRDRRVTG